MRFRDLYTQLRHLINFSYKWRMHLIYDWIFLLLRRKQQKWLHDIPGTNLPDGNLGSLANDSQQEVLGPPPRHASSPLRHQDLRPGRAGAGWGPQLLHYSGRGRHRITVQIDALFGKFSFWMNSNDKLNRFHIVFIFQNKYSKLLKLLSKWCFL